MAKKDKIEQYLKLRNDQIGLVFPTISSSELYTLNLSRENPALSLKAVTDTNRFDQIIASLLPQGKVGIGGYMERRSIYQRSSLYFGEETRSIHLGVDVWTDAYTPLFAPLPGVIHSFQDNYGYGDYGPTIILEHIIEDTKIYTLYGHLSRESLHNMEIGQLIDKEQKLGELGPYPENGDWPPHLHFQVMTDLLGKVGDFPGVVAPSVADFYHSICIDPMLLLTFK